MFLRARVVVSSADEEQAVAALWESGCLGVQVQAVGRSRLTLDAYYPARAGRSRLGGRLRRALRASGCPGARAPRVCALRPGRWVEAWQRTLRPALVGGFLVVPEGRRAPRRARSTPILRVRYGQAFGTGEHASTRLCLRLMRAFLKPGQSVADLGTGSGILAMAACRLGAARVVAFDDDPVALRVARDNLRDNGLADRVALVRGDAAGAVRMGPVDLALVNIGAVTIKRLLGALATAVRPGGTLIAAGFLRDDEADLASAARPGFGVVRRARAGRWSALVLRRAATVAFP